MSSVSRRRVVKVTPPRCNVVEAEDGNGRAWVKKHTE